ncbi:MAG: helix-turn-helix transcriptional regulator [Kiritimatiellae bacterium]|nr:helix-turn-helix transcriptional regulator [Kiritimatiellia bacterium]
MNVPDKNIVGKRVQQARLKKKMTQDQLAAKLARNNVQIDRAGISKIENGSRCVYDYELKALASILDHSPNSLLSEG